MLPRRARTPPVLLLLALAAPARAATPMAQRLRQLEDAVRAQQQEIERLRAARPQAEAAPQPPEAAKAAEPPKPPFVPPDWLSKIAFFGDLRYRHEGFYHQPHRAEQDVTARNRERIRGRLGLRFTY